MTWLTKVIQSFARPLKWWIVIASWEQGLRVRLGKKCCVLYPGIHIRIPFLDRIYVKSVRVQCIYTHGHTLTCSSGESFTIAIMINYSINNIERLYNSAATPELYLLSQALSGISEYIAGNTAKDVSLRGVAKAADTKLQDLNLGIKSVSVTVVTFAVLRTYRLLTGDSWISDGGNLDSQEPEVSGERL